MTVDMGDHGGNLSAEVGRSFADLARTLGPAVIDSFTALTRQRDAIRAHLLAEGLIHPIPHFPLTPYTIAAVDGGTGVEQMYAGDLLAATAVAAEGQYNATPLARPVLTWADMRPRSIANDQISRLNMLVRELALLSAINHEYRIVDGTHLNPFIALVQAIEGRTDLSNEAIKLLHEFDVASAASLLGAPNSGVVSLAKADTESVWSDELRKTEQFADLPPVMDKVLTAMVLDEGEMLAPRKVPSRSRTLLNVTVRDDASEKVQAAAADIDAALKPLQSAAVYGLLQVTYIKPKTMLSTLKMQFTASDEDAALAEAGPLAAVIGRECHGPALQEPLPQYLADQAAKNVSAGLRLMEQTVLSQLPTEVRQYAALLAFGYRS